MASGKQLSFENGEVAPSQHYKSNAISYAQGLRKLRNMFVRRDGGVSNRSGFRLWGPSPYQYDVTSLYNVRKIRTFVYGGNEYTVVKKEDRNYLYVNGSEISQFFYEGANRSGGALVPPDPSVVRFVPTKDGVFITPACTFEGCTIISYGGGPADFDINTMSANVFIEGTRAYVVQKSEMLNLPYTGTKGFTGSAPFLPVSYLVTATMKDGREVRVHTDQSTGFSSFTGGSSATNPSGNSLCFPHSQLTSNLKIVFTAGTDISNVKFFNLYRASGQEGIGQSFFKLAGRLNNAGGLTINFTDFGADDPSVTPPLDFTYFQSGAFVHARVPLTSVEMACYYQQRLMIMGSFLPNLKTGEVVCSALGAPRQIAGPLITSNLGAFTFSVPISDGSAISGFLAMERALIMTGKGVYIVRGGEQGVLTPSTVNPLKISDEGGTSAVEPTMSGSRGFWINAAKTKLMVAEFGADGNVAVGEASILSNHFLRQGIVQMESIGGGDNSCFLVTREGKLVRATVGEGGVFGFSMYETDGFVESIYRSVTSLTAPDGSGSVSPEVLYAYVIRNGVRFQERIEIREDRFRDQELFADCALWFGFTQVLDNTSTGVAGYIKQAHWNPWSEYSNYDPFAHFINIQPPVAGSHSWQANETIKIRSNLDLFDAFQDRLDFVIHFYYDEKDSDGNYVLDENGRRRQKTLRYVIDTSVPAVLVEQQELTVQGIYIQRKAVGPYSFNIQLFDPTEVGGSAVPAGSEYATWDGSEIVVYLDKDATTVNQVMTALLANATIVSLFNISLVGSGATVITAREWVYSNSYVGNTFAKYLHREYEGYFTSDVPEDLRDIRGQYTVNDYAYYVGLTRWLPAFSYLQAPIADDILYSPLKALYTAGKAGPLVVVGEGEILSSPLNPNRTDTISIEVVGSDYRLNFGDYYAWGYVGLPYMSEMETLDIETGDNRTLTDAKKLINKVGFGVLELRGGFFGMPGKSLDQMEELVLREDGDITQQTQNKNGHIEVSIPAEWTEGGRVSIKNVDPVPMTILSVYPKGIAGD